MISSLDIADATGKRTDSIRRSIIKGGFTYTIGKVEKTEGKRTVSREALFLSEQDGRKLIDSLLYRNYTQIEHGALCAIEQVLGIKLVRQYKVGSYRIDGYHEETNTAYEIDEPDHFIGDKLNPECAARQDYIEQKLGCTFVRVKV